MTSTQAPPPALGVPPVVTAEPPRPSRRPARTTLGKVAVMLVLSAVTVAFV